jgi:beta-alanine degradation protein BauB
MRRVLFLAAIVCLAVLTANAQDPVQVDPKHHKVEFENAQVRVLRITVGPHEKTAAHEHPDWVATALTDVHVKNTFPDGKTEERHLKAGEAQWHAGEKHTVENLSDKPFEVVMVELKGKATKAKPAAKKKA